MKNEKTLPEEERARLTQNILRCLRIVFRATQNHSRVVEKKCGMSSAKLWMLWEIHNRPGMKVSELAEALIIHASTCSNLLDKLQEAGLVRRERGGRDQRAVLIYLTAKGKKLLSQAPEPPQGMLSQGLSMMKGAALHELDNGLGTLINVIESIDRDAGMVPLTEKQPKEKD